MRKVCVAPWECKGVRSVALLLHNISLSGAAVWSMLSPRCESVCKYFYGLGVSDSAKDNDQRLGASAGAHPYRSCGLPTSAPTCVTHPDLRPFSSLFVPYCTSFDQHAQQPRSKRLQCSDSLHSKVRYSTPASSLIQPYTHGRQPRAPKNINIPRSIN